MRQLTLVPIILLASLLLAPAALAEDTDLKQTVDDLTSQTDDKKRMDTLGSSDVEINQIRTWVNDATNAIQEEAEKKCRQIFERIRSQLKLIDEQISLSKLEDEARKIEEQATQIKQKAESLRQVVEEKQAKLRALKMRDK